MFQRVMLKQLNSSFIKQQQVLAAVKSVPEFWKVKLEVNLDLLKPVSIVFDDQDHPMPLCIQSVYWKTWESQQ